MTADIQFKNANGEFESIFPLSRPGSNASWVDGRDHVLVKTNSCASNQYCPVISAKSQNGSWEIGPYTNDTLHFSYILDSDYSKGDNTKTGGVEFSKDGKINAKALLNAYPVGALYISYQSTSPASLFGGSWSQISGRFLYCTTNVGTGGNNNHTLTVDQMPSHNHAPQSGVRFVHKIDNTNTWPEYDITVAHGGPANVWYKYLGSTANRGGQSPQQHACIPRCLLLEENCLVDWWVI